MKLQDQEFRYKNPNTTAELIIPVSLEGVLSHEQRLENFKANCQFKAPWLNAQPERQGTAIVCGAAPSLNDHAEEIKNSGATILACNTAAQVLDKNGIISDFQVLLDPQTIVIDEFCQSSKTHLLASIVDPRLFKMSSNPMLWHPDFPWIWEELKDVKKQFCYVGGAVSVGTYSLSLAYTLGFRNIKVYGMDSSFKNGITHANGWHIDNEGDGRIKVIVENAGKTYRTTYDMKQQVLIFLQLAELLEKAGCKIDVIGSGLLPDVWSNNRNTYKIDPAVAMPANA